MSTAPPTTESFTDPQTELAEDEIAYAGALDVLKRGLRASPELRQGLTGTIALAFVAAAGRVLVPILSQQALDRGFDGGQVRTGVVVPLLLVGLVALAFTTVAAWWAQSRLAISSERALSNLRVRTFDH